MWLCPIHRALFFSEREGVIHRKRKKKEYGNEWLMLIFVSTKCVLYIFELFELMSMENI